MEESIPKAEKDQPPFSTILKLIKGFVERLRSAINFRIGLAIAAFCIGTVFIIGTLCHGEFKDLGNAGAALIAIGGLFYGTIGFALLQGILDRRDKFSYALEVQKEFEEISNEDSKAQNKKFEARFYEILKVIFT